MDHDSPSSTPLMSVATADAVIDRAAALSAAGIPLPAGLRAAAAEADSWRLAWALRGIASELERGRSLDSLLSAGMQKLPPHLAGLIRAANRTGEFGPMLAAWLENRRAAQQHWRAVMAALAYPAITCFLAVSIFYLFATLVSNNFKVMFEEFGLRLPYMTKHFLWVCDFAVAFIPGVFGVGLLAAVALRLIGGRAGWSLLMTSLPIVGANWHWTGVAEMLRCLSLLVERRVPLPEALQLTADGIADAYVASQCRKLAEQVDQGTSLTMSLIQLRSLPLSIVPLVHWGERHDLLSQSLRSAAEMIEGRLALRTDALVQILPPVIFLRVGVFVGSGVVAIFLPLISLIQGLS
jgi:type II secretory pathway component PulF